MQSGLMIRLHASGLGYRKPTSAFVQADVQYPNRPSPSFQTMYYPTQLLTVLLVETLVLALLDSILLDSATVVGVLHAWLDFSVSKGTCEASEHLLGFLVALGLAILVTMLLVLASSKVGSTSGSKLMSELGLVVVAAVDDLVMGLALIRVITEPTHVCGVLDGRLCMLRKIEGFLRAWQ